MRLIPNHRGQASLEMSAAFAGMLMLLFCCCKVFFWTTARLIHRDEKYEKTRRDAGSQSMKSAMAGTVMWDDAHNHKWDDPTRAADDPCTDPLIHNKLHFFRYKKPVGCH